MAVRRLSGDELTDFTEGLAVLVSAGLPLDYALETLNGVVEAKKVKELAAELLHQVREGYSLSYALNKAGNFTEAYVGMVRAGEMAGTLPQVMEQLADGLRRSRELTRHILSSLLYPAILLLVAVLAIVFILTYVLPSFVQVFQDMNIPLPLAAKVLMAVGNFMEAHGLKVFIAVGLAAVGLAWAARQPAGRKVMDRGWLAAAVVGKVVATWQTVLYCRTLGLLVTGGVPLNEACHYARAATTNTAFKEGLEPVVGELQQGRSLTRALTPVPHIVPVALRMIALGEETGKLGDMLLKAADYLEGRLKVTLGRLVTVVEPAIILFMGAVVGAIVVTMLTTILQLTQGGF